MKLFNFYVNGHIHLGVLQDGTAHDATAGGYPAIPATMEHALNGTLSLQALETAAANGPVVDVETIHFAPAVTAPEKILCVGLNYAAHAKESHMELPKYPTLFSKFSNALLGHKEAIRLPETAEKYDYEAELVIVIGKEARQVSKEEAPGLPLWLYGRQRFFRPGPAAAHDPVDYGQELRRLCSLGTVYRTGPGNQRQSVTNTELRQRHAPSKLQYE